MQQTHDTSPELGAALATWCAERKKSMRSLSQELGRGDKYIADIISGRSRRPEAAVLARLAEITGLPLAPPAADPRAAVRAGVYLDQAIALVLASELPEREAIARDVQRLYQEWLRRDPAEVPADTRWLRERMKGWTGATHGVSDKRLANVRSHVNRALELIGSVAVDRRPILAVGPIWRALVEAMPMLERDSKRARPWYTAPLSNLIRYCDRESVSPDAVDEVVIAAFADERERLSVSGFTTKKHRELVCSWNKAADEVRGWPQRRLTLARAREPLLLPLDRFPQSFRDDLDLYLRELGHRGREALERARVLDRARASWRRRADRDGKRGRSLEPLAPRTAREHVATLHLLASRLVALGRRQAAEITDIADVGSAAVLVDDIEARLGLASQYAGGLVKMLGSIALRWRDDIGADELDDFAGLRAEAEQEVVKGMMSERDRRRLSTFMDPTVMARFVILPRQVIAEAEAKRLVGGRVDRDQALQVQTAIVLLLEQTMALRLGTVVRTHLDRHLVRQHVKDGAGSLLYHRDDTKTGQPLSATLAAWKVALIDTYVRHYRTLLANGAEDRFLFPGDAASRPKSGGSIAVQTRKLIQQRLGIGINFHLLRKIMGSWLLQQTRDAGLVAALLGHKDGSSVTRLYAEWQTAWAVEALDERIEALLGGLPAAVPARLRKAAGR